jgi:hypothetical protein
MIAAFMGMVYITARPQSMKARLCRTRRWTSLLQCATRSTAVPGAPVLMDVGDLRLAYGTKWRRSTGAFWPG